MSGVLVPERDDEELAWALVNAVEDSAFLWRIGRSGADMVQDNFDLRMQTRRLEDTYLQTIG